MQDAYHLALDGQSRGPFTLEQVRGMWQEGRVTASTLFWRPGDPAWQPLSEIAFALNGTPPPSPGYPPPMQAPFPGGYYPPPAWAGGAPATSGVAVASFVLGLSSLLLVITFLPAIICGHVALSQIKQSAGRLTGRGFAIAGLLLGYLWIGLVGLGIVAGLLLPIFGTTRDLGAATMDLARAKEVGLAIKLYEGDHDGKTPPDLEALIPKYLPNRTTLISRLGQGDQEPGYEYLLPNTKVDDLDAHTVLLRGKYATKTHRRVYIYLDDSGELKRDL